VDQAGRRLFHTGASPRLPAGVTLQSLAANRAGVWALVRIESKAALKTIDSYESVDGSDDAKPARVKASGRASDQSKTGNGKGDTPCAPAVDGDDAKAPVPGPASAPVSGPIVDEKKEEMGSTKPNTIEPKTKTVTFRLLKMSGTGWQRAALPDDWTATKHAWLVMLDQNDARPALVAAREVAVEKVAGTNANAGTDVASTAAIVTGSVVKVYQWQQSAAKSHKQESASDTKVDRKDHDGDSAGSHWFAYERRIDFRLAHAPVVVDRQLVIAEDVSKVDTLAFSLRMIDQADVNVRDIGVITVDRPANGWQLLAHGDGVILLTETAEGKLAYKGITLRGEVDEQPTILEEAKPQLGEVWGLLIFLIPVILATPVLMVMWRRVPGNVVIELPQGILVSDVGARFFAAVIDLAPCIAIACVATGVSFEDLLGKHWPGRAANVEDMLPGGIAVILFVVHTFIGELFTAQTLGKKLLGLRVVGAKGQAPDIWQVLARNIFKCLDLFVPILMIFMVMGPFKQRLGDLVARTVIVSGNAIPVKTDDDEDSDDDNDSDDENANGDEADGDGSAK